MCEHNTDAKSDHSIFQTHPSSKFYNRQVSLKTGTVCNTEEVGESGKNALEINIALKGEKYIYPNIVQLTNNFWTKIKLSYSYLWVEELYI